MLGVRGQELLRWATTDRNQMMKKLRVMVITDISGYMRGGVPAETCSLINGLGEHGHCIALVGDALPSGASPSAHYEVKLPVDNTFRSAVKSALAEFKPDFVHVICMSSRGIIVLEPVLSGFSWALTVHSVPPYERKLNIWHGWESLHYFARFIRFSFNGFVWRWIFFRSLIPRIIVHSEFVRDVVIRYGAKQSQVVLIPLPFEQPVRRLRNNHWSLMNRNPLLVTVGGFAHTKGQHDVIKAMPCLIRRFPGIHYQMIGEVRDETYLDYLRHLAEKCGVMEHLTISPDLDHVAKIVALSSAAVYVQPSHEEGFCLAYAEAAALVLRLVGSEAGAIPAMSRGDVGMRVVPVRSSSAICAAVTDLLSTEMPAELLLLRSQRLSREFSAGHYIAEHERVYIEHELIG